MKTVVIVKLYEGTMFQITSYKLLVAFSTIFLFLMIVFFEKKSKE